MLLFPIMSLFYLNIAKWIVNSSIKVDCIIYFKCVLNYIKELVVHSEAGGLWLDIRMTCEAGS